MVSTKGGRKARSEEGSQARKCSVVPIDGGVPTNSEFLSWQDGDVDTTKLNTDFGLQRMLVNCQIGLGDCP